MRTQETAPGLSWTKLFEHWEMVKWDIAERFGVDLDTEMRSWHWVVARIGALISAPVHGYRPDNKPMYATRLQALIYSAE